MAKQSIGQKAQRVLRLLIGVRNPRIAGALAAHGFTQRDLQDGLDRLGALAGMRLDLQSTARAPGVITALDEFENTWFPVARASLEARYPEVASVLFRNLTQQTGVGVVVSVSTFLKRLAQMETSEGGFDSKGAAARSLLVERGLTKEKVEAARALVAQLGTFAEDKGPDGPSPEQQRATEEHLWAWYREWSGIARVAISDGRLLRSLGLQGQRATGKDELVEHPDDNPASPSPALPAAPAPVVRLIPEVSSANAPL